MSRRHRSGKTMAYLSYAEISHEEQRRLSSPTASTSTLAALGRETQLIARQDRFAPIVKHPKANVNPFEEICQFFFEAPLSSLTQCLLCVIVRSATKRSVTISAKPISFAAVCTHQPKALPCEGGGTTEGGGRVVPREKLPLRHSSGATSLSEGALFVAALQGQPTCPLRVRISPVLLGRASHFCGARKNHRAHAFLGFFDRCNSLASLPPRTASGRLAPSRAARAFARRHEKSAPRLFDKKQGHPLEGGVLVFGGEGEI